MYIYIYILQAFDLAEKEFGIPSMMSGEDMAMCDTPDLVTMVSYLSQFYEYFRKESVKVVKGEHSCYQLLSAKESCVVENLLNAAFNWLTVVEESKYAKS